MAEMVRGRFAGGRFAGGSADMGQCHCKCFDEDAKWVLLERLELTWRCGAMKAEAVRSTVQQEGDY